MYSAGSRAARHRQTLKQEEQEGVESKRRGEGGKTWERRTGVVLLEGISELQERSRAGVTVTQKAGQEMSFLVISGDFMNLMKLRAHPNDAIRSRGPMPRGRCPRDPHKMSFEGYGVTEDRHRDAHCPWFCQKGPLRLEMQAR